MQAGIGNSLTHSLWLWGFGHMKIQVSGLTFYETRWLWRHLCQQDTALCSRCQTAEWMSSRAAQKIDQDCMHGSLSAHPSVFQSILNPIHWQKVGKSCCIPWTFWKYLLFNTTSPLRWKTLISSPMLYMYIMKDGSYRKTCIHASLYHQLLFTADGSIHKNSFTNQSS